MKFLQSQICELMREAFLLRQLHQIQQCRFVLGVRDVPALSALTVGRSSVVSESAAECGDSNQLKQRRISREQLLRLKNLDSASVRRSLLQQCSLQLLLRGISRLRPLVWT
ncbi:uncharacterized protein LOC119768801 [Culex quinquefasciatus]|uniref:uncharacterized protein LOC119768801 n=1 Tax=Culex quinquefasciatus TaxID=7176 RepID=UPI0018E3C271|nr:uncharacterized protein LOC119768801 [Culex quinquefasciatus]